MKKLLLLVSCCVVILVLSKMSFAQEVSAAPAATCPCVHCTASQFASPFAYPPQRPFGGRFAGLASRRAFAPQMLPAPTAGEGPAALPYPYGISDLRPSAVRRAALLTPQPQPYPVPHHVAVVPPASARPTTTDGGTGAGGPATFAPGPFAQNGKNISIQRSGYTAPVVNFMSVVRGAPRYFEPGY